jgi:hypothetical protein
VYVKFINVSAGSGLDTPDLDAFFTSVVLCKKCDFKISELFSLWLTPECMIRLSFQMQTSQRMFMGVFVHVYSRRWKGFVVKILVRRIKYLL